MRDRRIARRPLWLVLFVLACAALACAADDVIGQRPDVPTPTVPPFATATPGGRISVWLTTPGAQIVSNAATTATPIGNIVGPAATATAAFGTMQAATATALAPVIIPVYQPNNCPEAGVPLAPRRPDSFALYAQAIGLYLSAGGPTTTLESALRSWGAINEGRGIIQSDTDVTGDGVSEIILTIFDPASYRADQPSPGQLLIFGCVDKGYKLLYSTPYSPGTMLPDLKRVGNLNGDGRAQIAFAQQYCSTFCSQTLQVLNWNSTIGAFSTLSDSPMDATNAKISIGDVDGDGVLEVSMNYNPSTDPNAGPFRRTMNVWDWNGTSYELALTQKEAPIYRIHAAYDADALFDSGEFKAAIKAYDKVRDDPNYQLWAPNDAAVLRAYASYRKMLIYAASRQGRAVEDVANALIAENGPGSSTDAWGQLASTFFESYKRNKLRKVCATVQSFLTARPDLVASINIYGYTNHVYTGAELCPF